MPTYLDPVFGQPRLTSNNTPSINPLLAQGWFGEPNRFDPSGPSSVDLPRFSLGIVSRVPVPAPSSLLLIALGLVGMVYRRMLPSNT